MEEELDELEELESTIDTDIIEELNSCKVGGIVILYCRHLKGQECPVICTRNGVTVSEDTALEGYVDGCRQVDFLYNDCYFSGLMNKLPNVDQNQRNKAVCFKRIR